MKIIASRKYVEFAVIAGLVLTVLLLMLAADLRMLKPLYLTGFYLAVIALAVFYSTPAGLFILLFLGFAGQQLVELGANPDIIYIWDYVVILLFLKALFLRFNRSKKLVLKGIVPMTGIIIVLALSFNFNQTDLLSTLLFGRYLLIGYGLFLAVLNLDMTPREINFILWTIVVFFLIQIPASVIKLFIFGQSEHTVGTFGFSPGELGVLVPLFATSFLLAFYLYDPGRRPLYIFLIFGYIAFSLMAEKRAFIFFLPILFLFLLFIASEKRARLKIRMLGVSIVVFLIAGYFIPRLNPSMNPQNAVWGEFDLGYLFNYVQRYTNLHDPQGRSMGRLATTQRTVENIRAFNAHKILLGDGPGKFINSGLIYSDMNESKFAYDIEDGITGFTWVTLQIGLLGMVIYLFFFLILCYYIWGIYKNTEIRSLKILGLGLLGGAFVFLLDTMVYSKAFMSGRHLSMVFFIVSAIYLKSKFSFGFGARKHAVQAADYPAAVYPAAEYPAFPAEIEPPQLGETDV